MTTPTDHTSDPVLDLIDRALAPEQHPFLPEGKSVLMTAEEGEQYAAALGAWRIDGERTALWAANKLARAEARRAEAQVTADRLRRMADEHQATIDADTEHDIAYFTGKLREYHYAEIDGTRRKTTKLPGGHVLASRQGSVKTDIVNEAAAIEWLEDHNLDAIDYTDPTIKKAAIQAAYDAKVADEPGTYPAVDPETGELVPGIAFVRGEPTFGVSLGHGDDE